MRRITFLVYAVLWMMLISLSYYQQLKDTKRYAEDIAIRQAAMFFDHIVLIRQWNSSHGGVYAVDDGQIRVDSTASPFVETKDGRRLAWIGPTQMARELADAAKSKTVIRFHVASIRPSSADNKADDWELRALLAFRNGETSVRGIAVLDNQPYYRYIAPLPTAENCLTCAGLDDDGGGAISVSIPVASIDAFISERLRQLGVTHGIIASVGVIVLLLSYLAQVRLSKRLDKAKSRLQLAYLDSLTLLPNRRYYDAFVKREWKRAMRHQYPISMIMIDIDYFKAYNDSLGHPEGDQCLRQVARTLKRFFRRPGDLIARYGGEEFCVVAACDANQILALAEILRKAIENMRLPHPNSKISEFVTISLGVSTIVPREHQEFEQLLHAADQALYNAKASGRNRVGR
ncbi:GGDEF domain-containing protein [Methylomonas sp. MV1]|uniref:GGDEF domain-containing protein n=1 Tax=unclassified Methylomonas TaxID=2608980 RepID=UPI0028A3E2E8|nr:diguanylate cyclase [Methylomonas sp. MV1]MDT4328857.1 diguanylate cyclase [Methylomonas sp. MV1]